MSTEKNRDALIPMKRRRLLEPGGEKNGSVRQRIDPVYNNTDHLVQERSQDSRLVSPEKHAPRGDSFQWREQNGAEEEKHRKGKNFGVTVKLRRVDFMDERFESSADTDRCTVATERDSPHRQGESSVDAQRDVEGAEDVVITVRPPRTRAVSSEEKLNTTLGSSPGSDSPACAAQREVQMKVDEMMMQQTENPKSDISLRFEAQTFLPAAGCISSQEESILTVGLNVHSLASESLTLRLNDRVVLTKPLGPDLPTGTAGVVVGLMAWQRVRLDLKERVRKLKTPPYEPRRQHDYESAVDHLHAVEMVRAPAYPIVKFDQQDEEHLVLPETFQYKLPGVGTIARLQLPLLMSPLCRCVPPVHSSLYRCHNGGPNHGRWFFTCAKPVDEQCSYFIWRTAKIS